MPMPLRWEQAKGFVRHLLTIAGGWLVHEGLIGENDVSAFIGAAATLVGLIWSYYDKQDRIEYL